MTKKQLAALMGFDPSYVSHVEGRRHRPTEDFARRAEAVLAAGGAIWQRFREYDELRHARGRPRRTATRRCPEQWLPPGTGLDRRAGDRHAHLPRRRVPVRDPARALQRRHRAGDPLPGPGRGRPLPERPGALQPAPPRAPAHLRRAASCRRTAATGRPRADALAGQARPGRVQGDLAALRERGRPVPALPRRADHHRVRLPRRAGEVGALVPAGRTAADPAARRPAGLPARPRPAGLGRGDLAVRRGGPAAYPDRREHDARPGAVFEWSTDDPPLNARYRLQWRFRRRPTARRRTRPSGAQRPDARRRRRPTRRGPAHASPAGAVHAARPTRPTARDVVDRLMPR